MLIQELNNIITDAITYSNEFMLRTSVCLVISSRATVIIQHELTSLIKKSFFTTILFLPEKSV